MASTLLLTACASGGSGVVGPGALGPASGDPVGQWGEIADGGTYVTILPDGTMQAHDGCNGMGGSWKMQDGVVVFHDVLTTLMACPGQDSWLVPATAVVRGETLVVYDHDGDVSGTLPRVGRD